MSLINFFKELPARISYKANLMTMLEIVLSLSVPLMVLYANPLLFTEGASVENSQLLILSVALIIALKAKQDRKMFIFIALIIILMLMRETNLGRSYFCAKYLTPDEMCRWRNMKYGIYVEPMRNLYGVYIVFYFLKNKIYKSIWQYIKNAPVYLWDIIILVGSGIIATLAEWPQIDNEILEESCETLFYLTLVNCIWRYSRTPVATFFKTE